MNGKNTCDKCKEEHNTNDLIWITAEDFEPKQNENVPYVLYGKYDALCESCYLESIEVEKWN